MPVIASAAVSNTEHLSQLDSLGARHTPEESSSEQLAGSPLVRDTILDGRYRLCDEIGRGGMGSVWRAERLGWQADVAVKLMTRTGPSKPGARRRFEREVRLAARVRSPHVVQVLDHGVHAPSGTPFLVMELLEGESLAARLRRTGRLSVQLTFQLVVEVGRALSRAHEQGIIHRDLKPDNLFLVPNGDDVLVKVLDFGVAKWVGPSELDSFETRPGSVVGSPLYMSPEQLRSDQAIDARTDLWSLAVIVCECLTGVRPFDAPDFASLAVLLCGAGKRGKASELGPVPPGFDRWFARATDTDPSQRFATLAEFTESLRKVCQRGGQPNASVAPPGSAASPRAASHRAWRRSSANTDSLAPTLAESQIAARSTLSRIALGAAIGLSLTVAIALTLDRLESDSRDANRALLPATLLPPSSTSASAPPSAPSPRTTPPIEESTPVPVPRVTPTREEHTAAPASAATAASTPPAAPEAPVKQRPALNNRRPRRKATRPRRRPSNARRSMSPAQSPRDTQGNGAPNSRAQPKPTAAIPEPADTTTLVNGHRIRTSLRPTTP